jgi:aspartate/methionine/tyrosine aminotransferase
MPFPGPHFMAWAKSLGHDIKYDLFSSGVHNLMDASELIADKGFVKLDGEHSNGYGYQPLKELLARKYRVDPIQVMTSVGSSHANYLIAAALFEDPGGQALIETPCYQPLLGAVQGAGAEIGRFERRLGDSYQIDIDWIKSHWSTNVRLVVITRLHNPSGVDTPESTLRELNDLAAKNNAWVLVDEVFLDFLDNPVPAASIGNRLISTNSFTKTYGLGDLRFGWAVCDPAIIRRAQEINDYISVLNPFISEYMGYRILSSNQIMSTLRNRCKQRASSNWEIVKDWVSALPEWKWAQPDGGVVFFPKIGDGNIGDRLNRILIDKWQTVITPGSLFDKPEHIRVGFAIDPDELKEGLRRLREAYMEIRK